MSITDMTFQEVKSQLRLKRVKLRTSKMDKMSKGYYPIYKNLDENGSTLTYIVKLPKYLMEFNSLEKAKIMAIKIK